MTSRFYATRSVGQNQARRQIPKKFARWRYQFDVGQRQRSVESIRMRGGRSRLPTIVFGAAECFWANMPLSASTADLRCTVRLVDKSSGTEVVYHPRLSLSHLQATVDPEDAGDDEVPAAAAAALARRGFVVSCQLDTNRHHIVGNTQQEGLAVAGIARDDPFRRAPACTATAMRGKLGSEFET